MLKTYLPLILLFIVVQGFVLGTLVVTHLLGPKRGGKNKNLSFECGIVSQGNSRAPFSITYFIVALLFVLFDVEVIFFYPWAINFKELGWSGLTQVGLFSLVVLSGFLYILKKKVLEFDQ
jgi:NADH-quinone oxidoreductase subunit A